MDRRGGSDHRGPFLGAADEVGLALDRGGPFGILRQIDHGRRRPDRIRKRHHRAAVDGVMQRAELRPHKHLRHHAVLVGFGESDALQFRKRHLH